VVKSSEDKFLARHMRMEYEKKPSIGPERKERALVVGHSKYNKRKK
tara:strand:+ start:823 stop:960 length:138 start_codon:yes stop_codon:yes gene_type:complete